VSEGAADTDGDSAEEADAGTGDGNGDVTGDQVGASDSAGP
jgi:hypothetical protein